MAEEPNQRASIPVSGAALRIVALILIVMALLALYANIQKYRGRQIETVTVTTEPTAAPSPNE